jgi:hypothetical protein
VIHPLWSREWRGGERRWWKHPGLVLPLVIAVPLAVAAVLSEARDSLGRNTEFWILCVGSRTLWGLPLWMIWAIVASFSRDRVSGDHHQIAATRISPRRILLIKIVAPAAPALCAGLVAGIITALWLSVIGHSAFEQITLIPAFLRMGEDYEISVLSDLLRPKGAALTFLIVQMALGVLVALTIASWLGVRRRGLVTSVLLGWGIWLLLTMLPIALDFGWSWLAWDADFFRFDNLVNFREQGRAFVAMARWQFLLQALSTLVLPMLWLAYWVRWARRDFEEEYLGGS